MNVKIGTSPMIMHDAMICHKANLNGDDDSNVNMDKPANIPVPMNAINSKISHHGIPRLRIGESPRRACTMFSLLVQNAVPHKVIIAIMKPDDIPINILSMLNE